MEVSWFQRSRLAGLHCMYTLFWEVLKHKSYYENRDQAEISYDSNDDGENTQM